MILTGTLPQAIASLQGRLRAFPTDWQSWANLGLSYVQEARVTADPRYYPKAQGALRRSLRLHPRANLAADLGQGALAAGRHDFAGALRWGDRARAVDRYSSGVCSRCRSQTLVDGVAQRSGREGKDFSDCGVSICPRHQCLPCGGHLTEWSECKGQACNDEKCAANQ